MKTRIRAAIALLGLAAALAPAATAVAAPATARPATAADGAHVVGEQWVDSRIVDLTIQSPALGRAEKVRLLVPPGWSRTANRTWPLLYLLHGGGGSDTDWTTNTDVEKLTAHTGVIVVMPGGGPCGSYSDWWNYGKYGPPGWETFHLTEVRGILEHGYRANQRRAIAGLSMGGLGATLYPARHPGMFAAAASFSGAVDGLYRSPDGGMNGPDIVKGMWLVCPGTDWKALWGDPDVPAQRVNWQQHDPAELAAKLRGLRLYIAAGSGHPGPYDLPLGDDPIETLTSGESHQLVARLTALGIPATVHWYDGKHTWPYWQREFHAAYPMLMSAIGAGTA